LDALQAAGAAVGDAFDHEIGGYTASGGDPYRIQGTIAYVGPWAGYEYTAAVSYGDGNIVFIAPAYTQIMYPERFAVGDIDPADYDVFVVKSRAHFRRGFDETGFAKTIIIVEATGPFIGTTFLDALPYENVDLSKLYPYGTPDGR
jgi:microcystin degradation protein MlrC